MSSSPMLLQASTSLLRAMLESKSPLFQLDKNPLMRAILLETFYKQFCSGANKEEISRKTNQMREQGYAGVILEYAREVLKDDAHSDELADIEFWKSGMLKSVEFAADGDFLAMKWSGMGPAAMKRMAKKEKPTKEMWEAMKSVGTAAAAKNMALLPSAEETWNLPGYHDWTMDMQREFNTNGTSVVYNTYQMYLKQSPSWISKHLEIAKAEGLTLGTKLVRGAYLNSEKRSLIHDTIEDTHNAYDSATAALLKKSYDDFLRPASAGAAASFPHINIVVASHNANTVARAQALRQAQHQRGETLTPLVFAQLQGMADEVSCSLLAAAKAAESDANAVKERVFKHTTWGTMYECLNYLLRRAAENKDAASRTGETRRAMQKEIGRRMRASVGLI